jgi:hypothetical protein
MINMSTICSSSKDGRVITESGLQISQTNIKTCELICQPETNKEKVEESPE